MQRSLVALLCASAVAAVSPVTAGAEIAVAVNGVVAAVDVNGIFTLERFVRDGDRLVGIGLLQDIPAVSSTPGPKNETIRVPVTALSRTCDALRLELGPADLDLQGKRVHLNEFAILVTDAERGPLGRALCTVADAPDDATVLVGLLNDVVDLVGCLMRGATACARQADGADHLGRRRDATHAATSPARASATVAGSLAATLLTRLP